LTVTVLDIIKRVLPRACRRAGLDRTIQWHVLRHTFASHLVMRGEPRKVVQELVGHANIESPIVTSVKRRPLSSSKLRVVDSSWRDGRHPSVRAPLRQLDAAAHGEIRGAAGAAAEPSA
jgi:integrase